MILLAEKHDSLRTLFVSYLSSLKRVTSSTTLIIIYPFSGSDSIILRRIGVPTYAVKGKEAVLTCDFDLEGQALYSVKWYKNGQEFFRYYETKTGLPS